MVWDTVVWSIFIWKRSVISHIFSKIAICQCATGIVDTNDFPYFHTIYLSTWKKPVGYGEDFVDFRDKVFQKELFCLNYANRIIRVKKCTIIKQDRTIAYVDSIVGKLCGKQTQYVAFGQCICFNTIIGRIALRSLLLYLQEYRQQYSI